MLTLLPLMTNWWQLTFPQGRQTLVIEDAGGERVAIAYGEKGTGQPMFLLHGIASWSYSWRHCIEPFSQQFRVICADAKGHGFSQSSSKPEIIGHQVIELKHMIQALADQPAILVGESLGALIALALAQLHPELISQLVLINVPIFPRQLPSWRMELLAHFPLDVVRMVDQWQLIRPFAPIVRELTRLARQEIVVDAACITDEELYWLTYPYIEFPGVLTQYVTDLQQGAKEIERSLRNEPSWISTIQENLHKVTCPTLILWGEQDQWFPVRDGEELHARLPNSKLQVIPNCGHNAIGCSPKAVSEAILAFLPLNRTVL
jgi:pimeloyl-ACP methyl ester carboxylesterase